MSLSSREEKKMSEPLNIYEMMVWIRQYDNTPGRAITYTMDFLAHLHTTDQISSETYWSALKELMIRILNGTGYNEAAV